MMTSKRSEVVVVPSGSSPHDGEPVVATPSAIAVRVGLLERHREHAAELYWAAFGAKLGKVLGPGTLAEPFLASVLNPTHAISAEENGKLLGLAGFKTEDGAFIGGRFRDLARSYGRLSALWRAVLLALLERPIEHGVLTMDGIAVAAEARGRGIGTLLLREICREAERRGLSAVRLDVIDTNPRARALYEREGFVSAGTQRLGPLALIFGFSAAETMMRSVGEHR